MLKRYAIRQCEIFDRATCMPYTAAEFEATGLCVAREAVGDIANHALLDVPRMFEPGAEIGVQYKSRQHQDLFLMRLLDFVKEGGDGTLTGVKGSCLDVLTAACQTRSFGTGDSIVPLTQATAALRDWLHAQTTFQMWLPTLSLNAQLTLQRIEFLYILGNHAKHNLSRLTRISKTIAHVLDRNGYHVAIEEIPLALDDFREHLREDYFVYYGTWLAELVNNVRWGIQDYLLPTFQRAYTPGANQSYSYSYPACITHDGAKAWFWRLMNHVLTGPYITRFVGSHYMKQEILCA